MIAKLVYALCGLTSVGCALLLLKSFFRRRSPLLLWSGLCFVLMGLSNILLFVDFVILPDVDLSVCRSSLTAAGMLMLVYGMISKPS